MSRHSRILGFGSAALMVVLGIAGSLFFKQTAGQLVAIVLVGLGLVLAIALVFLEVGLSEDRERAREAERRPAARPPAEPRRRNVRPRLERMRGSRRRLR